MASGSVSDPSFIRQPFHRQHWQVILLTTAVAAVLRMWGLGEWSLWVDEAHTWRDATMPFFGDGGFMDEQRRLYPLSFLMLRFLFGVDVLGFDEWSLRLPFALIGIITVPLLAICGRRFVGPWSAVIAACLLAVNPWHIFWSQNARFYGMVVLGSVLVMHRLHVLFESGRAKDLLLAAAFMVFAAGSHPTAFALVISFVCFLIVRSVLRTRYGAPMIVALAVLLIVTVPWLVRQSELFSDFLDSKRALAPMHWLETVGYYFRPSMIVAVLLGMIVAPSLLGANRALYLTCMVVVPVIAFSAIGSMLVKVTARYAICVLPAVTLLAGLLITYLAHRLREAPGLPRMSAWLLSAAFPVVLFSDYIQLDVAYFTEQNGQRGKWREASNFVLEEAAARGFSGVRLLTGNAPTSLYYMRRRHWFVGDTDPYPGINVQPLLSWRFRTGRENGSVMHAPGVEPHFEWHQKIAKRHDQMFAVAVTLPEMRELDRTWENPDLNGQFEAVLVRDFELVMHLPVWIGPKNESIYVYLPKKVD